MGARALLVSMVVSTTSSLIAACGSGASTPPINTTRVTAIVGAPGGALEHPAGAKLTIPEGALVEPVELTIEGVAAPAASAALGQPVGQGFQLGPEGQTFERPIELTLPANVLPAGTDLARVRVMTAPRGSLDAEALPTRVDAATGRVIAKTTHFSWFFLVVSSVPINFTTETLPDATVGIPYSVVLGANGGTAPHTFTPRGTIPGLTLAADGTLSGVPTQGGWKGVSVRVTDATGLVLNGGLYMRIFWTPERPTVTALNPVSADQGTGPVTVTITGTNFAPITKAMLSFTPLPTTFVSSTTLTAVIPASSLLTAGTFPVRVWDVDRGGYSNDFGFTVNTVTGSVVPTLSALSPNVLPAGSSATVVTLTGANFLNTSRVLIDGVDPGTAQYVSPTQLRVTVPAAQLATQGTLQVTVNNPAAGGGTSGALPLTVGNPVPALASVTPNSAPMGSTDTTVALVGSGFVAASRVYSGGTLLSTTFVSATQLTAIVPASLLTAASTRQIQVRNPAPAGGQSNTLPFTTTTVNAVPTLTSVTPAQIGAGASTFNMTLTGTGFAAGAVAYFGATALTTNVQSAASATAAVPAALVATAGSVSVTLVNPAPGGGTSGAVTFTIQTPNPAPTLSALSPNQVFAGAAAFTLTATGTGFVAGGQLNFGGLALTTTVVNATTATATVPANHVNAGGTKQVTFVNPAPGGGASGALTFTITTTTAPTLNSLTHPTVRTGSNTLPLGVWSNAPVFVHGAVVYADATPLPTMFTGSPYSLGAMVPQAMLATARTLNITVRNPGSPASNALTLVVSASGGLVPSISSATPNGAALGDTSTTVTIAGANFATSNQQIYRASAYWRFAGDTVATGASLYNNGQNTNVVNSGQLSLTLGAYLFATAGNHSLIVVNPPSGGGASAEYTFTVSGTNPMPDIASVSPSAVGVGTANVTVTLTGAAPGPRFVSRTRVVASGPMIATTELGYCEGYKNTCAVVLPAALMTSAGPITLTATSPAPGGGTGLTATVNVNAGEPTPLYTSHFPYQLTRSAPGQRLGLTGTGFTANTTVTETQSGASVPIASRTATNLQLDVPASVLDGTYATLTFALSNPGPGGGTGTSAAIPVEVGPWITSVSPQSFPRGTAFTMTITGFGLSPVGEAFVWWAGEGRQAPATTSATSWTVSFPASAFPNMSSYELWVTNGRMQSNIVPVTAQ